MSDTSTPNPELVSTPALSGERVSFTGTLASMTHKQAQTLVEVQGGTATEHVSKQTTMLVVGEEGWPLEADGTSSVKLQHVERLRYEGLEIRIVPESEWLGFVGLDGERRELHRVYTPAMLSQLLDLPVNVIRRWERIGLIRPVSRVCRLPYFDFQEVNSVRKLSQLVTSGVSVREIQNSLAHLRDLLPGIDRPLAQLQLMAQDQHLVLRDTQGRLLTASGQRLFDFDGEPSEGDTSEGRDQKDGSDEREQVLSFDAHLKHDWTAAECFDEGCRLSDEGELEPAADAFRLCLLDDATNVSAHFHLAELLYRLDNPKGALERYHMAVSLEPDFIEGWTQLGCLYAELGDPQTAVEAYDIALDIHADYPDAHLHKAEALHQLGKTADAVPHWKRYLEFDKRGPWADMARKRLEEA